MASNEIEDILRECPTPENGCLASDPEAARSLFEGDDAEIAMLDDLTDVASDAGRDGIPIEDVTYFPVVPDNEGLETKFTLSPGERVAFAITKFGITEAVPEQKIISNDPDLTLRDRLARCAYMCGADTSGLCPIFVQVPKQ